MDIEAKNARMQDVVGGDVPAQDFLADMRTTARDHSGTPMQWDRGSGAGFTAGTPWFALNPNADRINVSSDRTSPNSICRFLAELTALRRRTPTLIYGDYLDLDPAHSTVFAYEGCSRRCGPRGAQLLPRPR